MDISRWPLTVLLIVVAVLIVLIRQSEVKHNTKVTISSKYFGHILILILTAVIIGFLIGSVLNFPWKSNYYWILGLTLAVATKMFPESSGFAFGLTTLALIIGVFPSLVGLSKYFSNNWIVLIIVLVSSYILYRGLKLLLKNCISENIDNKSVNI